MQGFEDTTVYFQGIDTRGVRPISNQMTTDGQLLIGSTAAPNIRVGTLTAGTGITITPGAGTIQIASQIDYSTNSFVPTFTSDGTPPTLTYGVQRGVYVKIGKLVQIQILLTFGSYTAGTGNAVLSNLPFTSGTSTTFPPGTVQFSNVTFAGAYCVAYVNDGNTLMGFYSVSSGSGASQLQSNAFDASSTIQVAMTYISNT